MRYIPLAIAVLSLTMISSACGNSSSTSIEPDDRSTQQPESIAPGGSEANEATATYFAEPVIVLNQTSRQQLGLKPPSRSRRSPGLIEPTNKKQRQAELGVRLEYPAELSRDPFANAPGTTQLPDVVIPDPIEIPISLPPARPTRPAPTNRTAYNPPPTPAAQTIEVSGVVEIGGRRYAIVSIPGDISSRYVSVGQWIASDRVLVKRIEMSTYPRVILQQNGREYVHSVKLGI
jgi:hypothetical protein